MKIVISNTVALNTGDAAILRGELKILKGVFGPDTQFTIFDSQPEISTKYYPDLDFRKLIYFSLPLKLRRIPFIGHILLYSIMLVYCFAALLLRFDLKRLAKSIVPQSCFNALYEYKSADIIVSTGGTVLVENYDLTPRWFDFVLTLLIGKPLVLFTQSLGPFRKPGNKFLAKAFLNRAALIFLRDKRSKKHLIDIGINSARLFVCADAAFAFFDPKSHPQNRHRPSNFRGSIKAAISVREWSHFKRSTPETGRYRYMMSIRDLCIYLVTEFNARITLLSTCQGIPEYWTNDALLAAEIIKLLPGDVKEKVELNAEFHNPEDLIDLLKEFDITISTRLHMGILSFCAGTPSLLIAYEFKSKELFNRLNLSRFSLDIEELDSKKLIRNTRLFIQTIPKMGVNLFKSIEKEHAKAYLTEKILKSSFLPSSKL